MKAIVAIIASFLFAWLFSVIVVATVVIEWLVEVVVLQPRWHWRKPTVIPAALVKVA